MRAMAEHKVVVGLTADVELNWLCEGSFVSVGRGEGDNYLLSFLNALAADLARGGRGSPEGHDRRPPPQHLLDRARHHGAVSAQVLLCIRMLKQCNTGARQAVAHGLIPR